MPQSSRAGDMSAHGTIVTGAARTIVGGIPAARLGEVHVCPHGAGTVVTGSSTVIIEALPAARVTDVAVCPAQADAIVTGAPNVFIGG